MITLKEFELNDDVRVSTVLKNSLGVAIDPSALFFKFQKPDRTETIYQYGVGSELTKDSTGTYHVDIDVDQKGIWSWKFYSTGTGKAADAGSFRVVDNY